MPLTLNDTLVLKFLKAYIASHGVAPTYREIAEGCNYSTVSGIRRHLERLQAAGYLTFQPHKLRSIRLTERAGV